MDNTLQFSPYQLPQGSANPHEFDQGFLNTLQGTLGAEQQNQANNLEGFLKKSNLWDPNISTPGLLGGVLGSPQQRINQQILPGAINAASLGS